MADVEIICVKSGRNDDTVALWDRDPNHPADAQGNHEIFVSGRTPVWVGKTALVVQKLRDGDLIQVSGKNAKAAGDKPEASTASTPQPDSPDKHGGESVQAGGEVLSSVLSPTSDGSTPEPSEADKAADDKAADDKAADDKAAAADKEAADKAAADKEAADKAAADKEAADKAAADKEAANKKAAEKPEKK